MNHLAVSMAILLRLLLGLLATQLAVSFKPSSVLTRYANSWAVEVRGGEEVANALAKKHGLVNLGKVRVHRTGS